MVHSPFAFRHDQSLAFILVVAIHFIAGYGLWQTLRHISAPVIVPAQPLQVELLAPHPPTPAPQPAPIQSAKPNPPPKPQPKPVHQPKAAQPKPHHHKEVKKIVHKPKVVHKPKTAPLKKADHHKAVSKKTVHESQSAAREAPQASQAPEPTAPPLAASIHPAAPSEQTAAAPAIRREPVVYNADYLRNPAPVYPRLSRRLGETGKVLLQVFVDSNGRAEKVKIKVSSGYERLDKAALNAVRQWRFAPARENDTAVASWVVIPIIFKLQG